jgi:acetoin utilization deacetylase AcuC-like enzyme
MHVDASSKGRPRLPLYYSDVFEFPLPEGHRFPLRKYAMLRKAIERSVLKKRVLLHIPDSADDIQLLRVHSVEYLQQVKAGSLKAGDIRRIGFPWSPELVERSRRSVGGTIAACHRSFETGLAMNLAGGTHHAHRSFGSGFCVFNDVAVAVRDVQAHRPIGEILIIDCDVHQGDGTAEIFAGDPTVTTFSIHAERNFPFRKSVSDLDLALPDGVDDDTYLEALADALERLFAHTSSGLVIYLAGADPFQDDALGRMALTRAGLSQRDGMVLDACREQAIPLAIVLAGGYSRRIEDSVEIHLETVRLAVASLDGPRGSGRAGETA